MDFYIASIFIEFVKDKIFTLDAIKYEGDKIEDEDMKFDYEYFFEKLAK